MDDSIYGGMIMVDSIIISYDNSSNDIPILLVGKKRPNQSVEIVNAFQGDEATELYKRLTTVKKSKGDSNG